jgi:hypothetical protein
MSLHKRKKQEPEAAIVEEFKRSETVVVQPKKKKSDPEFAKVRAEERAKIDKIYAMLEAQGEMIKKLIKTDEVVHEEIKPIEETKE